MALVVAFLLFTRVLNGGERSRAADPAYRCSGDAMPVPPRPGPAAAPAAPAPADGCAGGAGPSGPRRQHRPPQRKPPAPSDAASAFVPGTGLPEEVVVAYARRQGRRSPGRQQDTGIDDESCDTQRQARS